MALVNGIVVLVHVIEAKLLVCRFMFIYYLGLDPANPVFHFGISIDARKLSQRCKANMRTEMIDANREHQFELLLCDLDLVLSLQERVVIALQPQSFLHAVRVSEQLFL